MKALLRTWVSAWLREYCHVLCTSQMLFVFTGLLPLPSPHTNTKVVVTGQGAGGSLHCCWEQVRALCSTVLISEASAGCQPIAFVAESSGCCLRCEWFQQVVCVCWLTSPPAEFTLSHRVKLWRVMNSRWITLGRQRTQSVVTQQPRLHVRGRRWGSEGELLHSLIPWIHPTVTLVETAWNTP